MEATDLRESTRCGRILFMTLQHGFPKKQAPEGTQPGWQMYHTADACNHALNAAMSMTREAEGAGAYQKAFRDAFWATLSATPKPPAEPPPVQIQYFTTGSEQIPAMATQSSPRSLQEGLQELGPRYPEVVDAQTVTALLVKMKEMEASFDTERQLLINRIRSLERQLRQGGTNVGIKQIEKKLREAITRHHAQLEDHRNAHTVHTTRIIELEEQNRRHMARIVELEKEGQNVRSSEEQELVADLQKRLDALHVSHGETFYKQELAEHRLRCLEIGDQSTGIVSVSPRQREHGKLVYDSTEHRARISELERQLDETQALHDSAAQSNATLKQKCKDLEAELARQHSSYRSRITSLEQALLERMDGSANRDSTLERNLQAVAAAEDGFKKDEEMRRLENVVREFVSESEESQKRDVQHCSQVLKFEQQLVAAQSAVSAVEADRATPPRDRHAGVVEIERKFKAGQDEQQRCNEQQRLQISRLDQSLLSADGFQIQAQREKEILELKRRLDDFKSSPGRSSLQTSPINSGRIQRIHDPSEF